MDVVLTYFRYFNISSQDMLRVNDSCGGAWELMLLSCTQIRCYDVANSFYAFKNIVSILIKLFELVKKAGSVCDVFNIFRGYMQ